MAALLVAMAVMAIMMTVAMPVWKQAAQREKEEELIFRGTQYTHAIGLFQRKYANAYPPTIDVLVEQRFLRKKFKDPITNEDFVPLLAGQAVPGSATPGGQTGTSTGGRGQTGAPSTGTPGRGMSPRTSPGTSSPGGISSGGLSSPTGSQPGGGVGGVMGVTSKSKDKSIRLYNGRSHYNEWAFVFTPQQQAPGGGAPGSAVPGQVGPPGQRGQPGQPGQRGAQPFPGGRPGGPGGVGRPGGPGGSNPFQPQPLFPPQRGRSGG